MSPEVIGLVLVAALCHATWNAFVKGSDDRVAGLAAINLVGGAFGILLMPWVLPPDPTGWLVLAASVAVHLLYKLLLALAYGAADLSRVYPLIRGIAPLVAGAIAVLAVGERMSAREAGGMAAISLGILALAVERGRPAAGGIRGLFLPALTGTTIGIYTVIDGFGARRAPSPFAFAAWLFALDGTVFLGAAHLWRGPGLWSSMCARWGSGLASGLVALGSFGVFLWALSRGAMGAVAALRETSVLFAAAIGALFLGDRLGPPRPAAAGFITLDVILIAHAR